MGERHQKAAANEKPVVVVSANRRLAGCHHPEKLQPTLYNYLLAVIGCHQSFESTAVGRFFRLIKRIIESLFSTNVIFREKRWVQ